MAANRGITLGASHGTIDVATSQTLTYGGIIAGSGNLTKSGAGTLTLSGVSTYTGSTVVSAGTITLGVANALPISASAGTIQFATNANLVLNLGLFNLGSSAVSANSAGKLDFDVNTTINLGSSGANTYYFKGSNDQTWDATTITINNWLGTSAGGTGPRIYIGSSTTDLTATQLAKITFTNYPSGAALLATGELVPASNITTYYSKSATADPTTLSNWNSNIDGSSGIAPTSFTTPGDLF